MEKILINSNPTLFISDNNNIMYAIDATNGKEKWSFSVGDSVFANPLFNNGILYFGAGSYSGKNNTFFALDSKTGDVKWKFPHNNGTVCASPVIYQGRIYFGVGDKFFVLDAITVQLIKTYDAIDVYKACIYDGNLFYTNSQFIQKINLADGQEETIMAFVYNANSFFIMNNVLYASGDLSNFGLNGDGDIRAFNILNNELIWSKRAKNLSYSTLKYANESIYYTDKQSLHQIDVKKE